MKKQNLHAWLEFGFLMLALAMRIVSTPTANLSYLLLAGYALLGRMQAIQALALSWLFSMWSPGLGAEATYGTIGRYAVLAGAAASVMLRNNGSRNLLRINRLTLATILLGVFLVFHSLFFSSMPDVSILKAVAWTVACATLISAWAGLTQVQRDKLEKRVFYGLIVLMALSLPLLVSPLGFLRNGTGFQGLLNHPQAFGPTMALLGVWVGMRMLSLPRPPWGLMCVFAACMVLIVLSQARTAGFSLLIALVLSAFVARALSGRTFVRLFPSLKSGRLHLMLVLTVIAMMAAAPLLGPVAQQYVSKRGEAETVFAAYEQSRGSLMDAMQDNIRQHPWTGIGFGIASTPETMEVTRDPILGLPVGANIEKGVLPLAVLEELGIPGAIFVAAWLWLLVRRSLRGGRAGPLAILFTALLLNMGEMMLFSPGGMGLLLLVLLGWSATETPVTVRVGRAKYG